MNNNLSYWSPLTIAKPDNKAEARAEDFNLDRPKLRHRRFLAKFCSSIQVKMSKIVRHQGYNIK